MSYANHARNAGAYDRHYSMKSDFGIDAVTT